MADAAPNLEHARTYFELAKGQLDRQYEAIGRVEQKLGVLLGFGFVLIGVSLSSLMGRDPLWPSAACVVILLCAQLCLARGYHTKDWYSAPNIEQVKYDMDSLRPAAEVLEEAVDSINQCFQENETIMRITVGWLNRGIVLLFVGVTAAIIVGVVVPGGRPFR